MQDFLFLNYDALFIVSVLLAFMFLATEVGNRIGRRYQSRGLEKGTDLITSSLLTLLALLLGFTISMAEARYSLRIELLMQEANTIGTAYLRVGLMTQSLKVQVEDEIRDYLAARVEFYRAPPIAEQLAEISARTDRIEDMIWQRVRAHVQVNPRSSSSLLIVNSINEMFDSRSDQEILFHVRMPRSINHLLLLSSVLVVGLVSYSFGLAGYHRFTFAALLNIIVALTMFVMLDLDRPRRGLIKIPTDGLVELQARLRNMS